MSAKLRVLVVDDEPPARRRLLDFLAKDAGCEVVGECGDGLSAARTIEETKPDMVLLDIQMPGCDGFEVLERVGTARMPIVIFVTAFDEYATRAFDVHALDYIEKPWEAQRLSEALDRARSQVQHSQVSEQNERLADLLAARANPEAACKRLIVKSGASAVFLELDEVLRVEAASNYLRVHTQESEYLARETLTSLAARLPKDLFVRIHRSHLVSIKAIRKIGPDENGELSVLLRDGQRLRVGGGYREDVQRLTRS